VYQPDRFAFTLVQADDLPLLARWRNAEHVKRWWGEPGDLQAEYLSLSEPTNHHLVLDGGQPIGLIEHYHWRDYPNEARVIDGRPDEDGFDYFLGESELIGQGLGPAMLSAFLFQVVKLDPAVAAVRLDVAEANRRSWRCLEKLGFRRQRAGVTVPDEPGPHYVYGLRFDAWWASQKRGDPLAL
jgi:aminoglycoside 6'-N-acetyltransferase